MTLKQYLCQLAETCYNRGYLNREHVRSLFSSIGSGCTRDVFEVEHEGKFYAVKFAQCDDERVNNRREASAWRQFRATTKKFLAEVHGISTCGRVLAMELVERTLAESDLWQKSEKWNEELREQLAKVELMTPREVSHVTCDNHTGNIGVRSNGDVVWIDYGVAAR